MQRLIVISLLVLTFSSSLQAQQVRDLNQSQQLMKMDEGVELMNQGKFVEADGLFREALQNVEVVPADLCFYFGKNSYYLEKFSQSIDWLNKYIELKGTAGRFFDQAVEYLKLSEADLNQTNFADTQVNQYREPPRNKEVLNCEEVPFVVCPVCKGEGVKIEKGALGSSVYSVCNYCQESGKMSCENYLQYVKGNYNPLD